VRSPGVYLYHAVRFYDRYKLRLSIHCQHYKWLSPAEDTSLELDARSKFFMYNYFITC